MELTIDKALKLKPTDSKLMTISELSLYFGIGKWHIYDVFRNNTDFVKWINKKKAMDSLKFWELYFKVDV